jgi:hypothetical protein
MTTDVRNIDFEPSDARFPTISETSQKTRLRLLQVFVMVALRVCRTTCFIALSHQILLFEIIYARRQERSPRASVQKLSEVLV